jgi:hypothetical protein
MCFVRRWIMAAGSPLERDIPWPWVNPTQAPLFYTLPAKARYDAGTPFKQP